MLWNYSSLLFISQSVISLSMRDKALEKNVKKLAEKFKELRLERGLSQAVLAKKIGMSDRAIGMIESHKRTPTILTCFKLSKALGVKLEDLIANL